MDRLVDAVLHFGTADRPESIDARIVSFII